jgi:hypothetical protein
MRCNICGGDRFNTAEYRADGVVAPAKECATCRALILDEEAAAEEDRDSVRLAVAARAAHSVPDPKD